MKKAQGAASPNETTPAADAPPLGRAGSPIHAAMRTTPERIDRDLTAAGASRSQVLAEMDRAVAAIAAKRGRTPPEAKVFLLDAMERVLISDSGAASLGYADGDIALVDMDRVAREGDLVAFSSDGARFEVGTVLRVGDALFVARPDGDGAEVRLTPIAEARVHGVVTGRA